MVACSRGAFALAFRTSQLQILVLPFALGLSACQTMDDAPVSNAWESVPPARMSAGASRGDRTNGAPLLVNARGGSSTVIEGSGRFVGDPPTGSISKLSEDVAEGVTLNLINVPAPQAAKTILGDILSVKYTLDPGIEGKITIQTPKPVARSAVIDLFQAALQSNKAALVNTGGLYRIVPADQAIIGTSIRTEDSPDPEQIGSGLQVVQLKYVAASEIRRVLETIAPRNYGDRKFRGEPRIIKCTGTVIRG
jgi:general secretion pathway protein D